VKQEQSTLDHHGYLTLVFIKPLLLMVDVYDHVFSHQKNLTTIDEVIASGKILLVSFPYVQKAKDEFGGIVRLFYLDLVRALKRRTGPSMVTAVIDNCEMFLPSQLDETMTASTDANSCLIFGWDSSPLVPSLKHSISIHLDDAEPMQATILTKSRRYRAAMRDVRFY
jgi:hypothetical protein